MHFVLRQIHPPGKSAVAFPGVAAALVEASIKDNVVSGSYLQWSDPDAKRGMGDDGWTDDLAKAKKFASFAAAMECWKAQSSVRPFRRDGRPNRPMTAYSVTVEKIE